jgi:hypothetical protein
LNSSPRRNFRRNTKGLASLIGLIFVVLIVFFLGTNVFLYSFAQNASFQEKLGDVTQKDLDARNERLMTSNTNYSLADNKVLIETQITNNGLVPVKILTLWVQDKRTNLFGSNDSLNMTIKSGETLAFTDSNTLSVNISGLTSQNDFTSWLITSRGNNIQLQPMEKPKAIVVAQLAQGIGSVALDLSQFRYFRAIDEYTLENYPNGILGFNIPKSTYVAYGCYLTNLDPSMQTITIDSHSLLWQPGFPSVSEAIWFIANVCPNGTISHSYTNITLNYGDTKMFVFVSKNDLSLGSFSRTNTPNVIATVATFLQLHGTIGSKAYAQNIPYVSLFYS